MTAKQIAIAFQHGKPDTRVTAQRVAKLKLLCTRSSVDYQSVLALLPEDVKAQMDADA